MFLQEQKKVAEAAKKELPYTFEGMSLMRCIYDAVP